MMKMRHQVERGGGKKIQQFMFNAPDKLQMGERTWSEHHVLCDFVLAENTQVYCVRYPILGPGACRDLNWEISALDAVYLLPWEADINCLGSSPAMANQIISPQMNDKKWQAGPLVFTLQMKSACSFLISPQLVFPLCSGQKVQIWFFFAKDKTTIKAVRDSIGHLGWEGARHSH